MFRHFITISNHLRNDFCKQFISKYSPLLTNTSRPYTNSSAYDGDGKTTVTVLNSDSHNLHLVDTYSTHGFRIVNNLFVYGSMLLFPTQVYSWNVDRGADINMDSLAVFDLVVPKIKILVIGYGSKGEPYDPTLPIKLKEKGISCEILPTPQAVTTYNYLVHDAVHVAGAFIPVKEIKTTANDRNALFNLNDALEESLSPPDLPSKEDYDVRRKIIQEIRVRDNKDVD